MTPRRDIDKSALWLARAVMVSSGIALAAGLLLHITTAASGAASLVLTVGLMLLMSIPIVRVSAVIVDRLWNRDYQMVVLTALVLVELSVVIVLAMMRV